MSDPSSSTGTHTTDGRGTHEGGGYALMPPAPPPPPMVTNQQLLVLDSNIVSHIPAHAANAVKLTQLEFARDVSQLAADAYGKILEELRPHYKRG